MPFTPFHFGPGAAICAMFGRRFSFTVFVLSQALIDLEPGVRMVLDREPLHPHMHTYAGATLVALVAGAIGRPLCEAVLRAWNRRLSAAQARWLGVDTTITPTAAWSAAIVGAYSHVAIDSIMHADMQPWMPFGAGNPLLGLVSIETLQLACAVLGLLGIGVMVVLRLIRERRRAT